MTEQETTARYWQAIHRSHCELRHHLLNPFEDFIGPMLVLIRPYLSPRPGGGIGILSTDSTVASSTQGGPPNRPLPPTPDDDAQGDRTLIMKRVSESTHEQSTSSHRFLCLMFREKENQIEIVLVGVARRFHHAC